MTREDIFTELIEWVSKPSYVYILSMMILNDLNWNLNDMQNSNPHNRLLPYEFSRLVSILLSKQIDFSYPSDIFLLMDMKANTERLMLELQKTYLQFDSAKLMCNYSDNEVDKTENNGELIDLQFNMSIESVLYSGEGLYDFQYTDYLVKRYSLDNKYLRDVHSYDVHKVKEYIGWIESIYKKKVSKVSFNFYQDHKNEIDALIRKEMPDASNDDIRKTSFMSFLYQFRELGCDNLGEMIPIDSLCNNILDVLSISQEEIKEQPDIEEFLTLFTLDKCSTSETECRTEQCYLNYIANPVIKLDNGSYFIPLLLYLYRATYERPFYWMLNDNDYRDVASQNRGSSAESIVYEMLVNVFEEQNVHKSVVLRKGRNDVSEIDILCIAGNYALIVQVKSKKLTSLAKGGDHLTFSSDFKGAFQDAYDQGLKCRQALLNGNIKLICKSSVNIDNIPKLKNAYILCVSTDNIGSMSLVIENHLVRNDSDPFPVALSIFDLELFTHYLNNPERFMYYMKQRISLGDKVHAINEISCLAHHLMRKLWIPADVTDIHIDQTCAFYIDKDYYSYKKNIDLQDSEDAFNSRWQNIEFDELCKDIMSFEVPQKLDVLFTLFDMSSEAREVLISRLSTCKNKSITDSRIHTISIYPSNIDTTHTGFTYATSESGSAHDVYERLMMLCIINKYKFKSDLWIGLGSFIESSRIVDFGYVDDNTWSYDLELEELVETYNRSFNSIPNQLKSKIGRNSLCPCGSKRKFKHCCGKQSVN